MKWIKNRLAERSTWAGLFVVAAAGQIVAADPKNPAAWFAALGGVASAVLKEKGAQ